jgi:hypothetical protein
LASEVLAIAKGGRTVRVKARVLRAGVGCEKSAAWMVTGNVPGFVGMPTMVPESRRERPSGRTPPVTLQV